MKPEIAVKESTACSCGLENSLTDPINWGIRFCGTEEDISKVSLLLHENRLSKKYVVAKEYTPSLLEVIKGNAYEPNSFEELTPPFLRLYICTKAKLIQEAFLHKNSLDESEIPKIYTLNEDYKPTIEEIRAIREILTSNQYPTKLVSF